MVENGRAILPESDLISDSTWKCKSIWGWTGEISIRVILAILYGASYFFQEPFVRYVEVHDWPSYNYPHRNPEAIAAWVVAFGMAILPFFLISGVTLIARFAPCSPWHRKFSGSNQKKLLDRRFATEWIIAILALSLGYLINGVITDVIKNAYGRPRPDFLSRCFTPKGVYLDGTSDYWLTLPTRDPLRKRSNSKNQKEAIEKYYSNPAPPQSGYKNKNNITFPYIEDLKNFIQYKDCVNDDFKLIVDKGRRSFPSGHSSGAFGGAMFCALYCYYWLGKIETAMNMGKKGKIRFPGTSLKLAALFLWFVPALYVGISRTQDYRHHATDVIAGALIGCISIAIPFNQYYDLWDFTKYNARDE